MAGNRRPDYSEAMKKRSKAKVRKKRLSRKKRKNGRK